MVYGAKAEQFWCHVLCMRAPPSPLSLSAPFPSGAASVCRMSHSPCGELLMTLISGQKAHVTNALRRCSQAKQAQPPTHLPSSPPPPFIPCTCNIATLEWKISEFLHMPHGNSCKSGAPTALPVCCSYKPPLPSSTSTFPPLAPLSLLTLNW